MTLLRWSVFMSFAFSYFALAPLSVAEPLRMQGKETLFQRVLVQKASPRRATPGGLARGEIEALAPLYVFERRDVDGAEWLRVDFQESGDTAFWIEGAHTLPWRQNIVLTFEKHGGLERLLLLESDDDVYGIVESENPSAAAAALRDVAIRAETEGGDAAPVVGLGPKEGVDLSQNFYFLPILDHDQALFEIEGGFVNILNVAVAKDIGSAKQNTNADPVKPQPKIRPGPGPISGEQRIGVVFVVDTTTSMDTYIKRTGEIVQEMYDRLADSQAGEHIQFGLIGFRDNVDAAPRVGYLTETFVPVSARPDARAFAKGLSRMTEARHPTRNFREDSFAGVDRALKDLTDARVDVGWIILITDAGPRDASDRLSSTKRSAEAFANLASEKGAYIATFHLRSAGGEKDHDRAEAMYRRLTSVRNEGDLYTAVYDGDLDFFERAAINLATTIADDVAQSGFNERIRGVPDLTDTSDLDPVELGTLRRVKRIAQALRLKYLGKQSGEAAPDVFSAWIADRDFDRTGAKPVEIRILLTKNQLSDLEESLRAIVESGLARADDPKQFFHQVVGAAADMSRRPDTVAERPGSLADAALLSDYLEGLPYTSEVMRVTEKDWITWQAHQQLEFIDGLAEKAERYQALNASPELWVSLMRDGIAEEVYPMLLDDLP